MYASIDLQAHLQPNLFCHIVTRSESRLTKPHSLRPEARLNHAAKASEKWDVHGSPLRHGSCERDCRSDRQGTLRTSRGTEQPNATHATLKYSSRTFLFYNPRTCSDACRSVCSQDMSSLRLISSLVYTYELKYDHVATNFHRDEVVRHIS